MRRRIVGAVAYGFVVSLAASLNAAAHDARGVTLLVQGGGLANSDKAAEVCWGHYAPTPEGRLVWSGVCGHLIENGWKFGGIIRSSTENVLPEQLDTTGATQGPADFYMLASSLASQQDGLDSRARELMTAVAVVRKISGAKQLRLACYSAGGVAARIWMQGALDGFPYEKESVSRLITVATPHMGIGGLATPVRELQRLASLAPDSSLLRRLNHDLDLPPDVEYVSVLIQGTGTSFADNGGAYRRALRISQDELEQLPPLLRLGHDGAVHCLSAQLHLTRSAARYENLHDRPVHVVCCSLTDFLGPSADDATPHTFGMRDPIVWRTIRQTLDRPLKPEGKAGVSEPATAETWAREIAFHASLQRLRQESLTAVIRTADLVSFEKAAAEYRWKYRCQIDTRTLFGQKQKRFEITGSCGLALDRFGRPQRATNLVLDCQAAGSD